MPDAMTPAELDEQRSKALSATTPNHALVYVGDCIRYQAEMALFIAEHRTIDPRPPA